MPVHLHLGQFAFGIQPYMRRAVEESLAKQKWEDVRFEDLVAAAYQLYRRAQGRKRHYRLLTHFLSAILYLCVFFVFVLTAILSVVVAGSLMQGLGIVWTITSLILVYTFILLCIWSTYSLWKRCNRAILYLIGRWKRWRSAKIPELDEQEMAELGRIWYEWGVEDSQSTFPYKDLLRKKFREKENAMLFTVKNR